MSEWISVKDRLPEVDTWVLVYLGNADGGDEDDKVKLDYVKSSHVDIDKWAMYVDKYITHWRPLPEAPK